MTTRILIVLALAGCHKSESGDSGTDTHTTPTTDTHTTPTPTPTGVTGTTGETGTTTTLPAGDASVLQHHRHPNRDGVFVDAALTKAAAATMHLDATFDAALSGPTYAQPLFVDGLGATADVLVVATEQNVVTAFDAADGSIIWQTAALAQPIALNDLPCGNINPLGITGTPYIDAPARTIYLDAMTTPDNGNTARHEIYALSLDDGTVLPGWPVDVQAEVPGFNSIYQNQRGALVELNGVVYVPYGGHYGDCGTYHGWLVGVDAADPTQVTAWSTAASGGGTWAPSGVSTDGTSLYLTTGNTFGATNWSGGDAVIRLAQGPTFSNADADYFAPSNWKQLDTFDLDMGTHALVDAPAVTPSALVLGFGKDGNIYVADQANLGGVGNELSTFKGATGEITGGVSTYTTGAGTFVTFRVDGGIPSDCPNGRRGNQGTVLMSGSPPAASTAWCSVEADLSLPIVSMTDPTGTDAISWNMSASRLYAYDAETGEELFTGGGGGDQMAGVRYFQTPIVAKGRVFVAGDDRLYAYTP